MHVETPTSNQQPCIHCGACARACPESLNPETLFFALVGEDWPTVRAAQLDACSECNRCVEVCPSHIPLLDWLCWGKSELHWHAQADAARTRFLARNMRLARERAERAERTERETQRAQPHATAPANAEPPAQTISRAEVLAAIARGRKKRGKS